MANEDVTCLLKALVIVEMGVCSKIIIRCVLMYIYKRAPRDWRLYLQRQTTTSQKISPI